MSAAVFPANGPVRQLDSSLGPEETVRPDQAVDPVQVARLLMRILRSIALLKRIWNPMRIDFEDIVVDATGTKKFRFEHKFGSRVRYWAVEWSGAAAPNLRKDAATDANTLVLTSTSAGTVTIRVEESG